ncbi:hypothetical protein LRS06_05685 [Hymenobacter sp. J193]|uniref:hypothetical protein n=1 Tax=Hymenobacter sp. J193 TaxID=2898429 RepID=UPI002151B82F|nr:hypothetical protein [Hymenobacter sp. J193]MCR5887278.1 hypothetical protein [Hymenobacter sp. J193]
MVRRRQLTARRRYTTALCLLGLSTACEKPEIRDIEQEETRWEGTWQVPEIRLVVTDTLGNVRSETVQTDQGTATFRIASQEGSDVFNDVAFEGEAANSQLVSYFRGVAAGNRIPGGWSLYWDADPEARRLMIWGIAPGVSYHRTVNVEVVSKQERKLFYIFPAGANGTTRNERLFYTLTLRK